MIPPSPPVLNQCGACLSSSGNVEFQKSRVSLHHDESVVVRNPDVVSSIAALLGVANATLVGALTAKRARVQGEVLVINYRQPEVGASSHKIFKEATAAFCSC